MGKRDERVDAYIAKAAPFAQPILMRLRENMHQACPDLVETIKWGCPFFDYKGKMLASMAAFKAHCAFGFPHAQTLDDPHKIFRKEEDGSAGWLGKITSIDQLPDDKILVEYTHAAMKLIEQGVKVKKTPKADAREDLPVPDDFNAALNADPVASGNFEKFPPSARQEYIAWLMDAKTPATRQKRLQTAIAWISEGKHRHWKYQQ